MDGRIEFQLKVQWTVWQLGNRWMPTSSDCRSCGARRHLKPSWITTTAPPRNRSGSRTTYEALATPATGKKIVCGALVRKGLRYLRSEVGRQVSRRRCGWTSRRTRAIRNPHRSRSRSKRSPGRFCASHVKLRDDQTPTEVFVTHLKSKLPTDVSEEAWFVAEPNTIQAAPESVGCRHLDDPANGGGRSPAGDADRCHERHHDAGDRSR